MKAFKLASGFAVSALTLAIAGTAVAEATTDVSITGNVRVQGVLDLENETRQNQMPGFAPIAVGGDADDNEDYYHLEINTKVTHGPFSGNVYTGIQKDDGADGTSAKVRVDNLKVEEGSVSFGDVGSVVETGGKLEALTDFDTAGETSMVGDGLKVNAAFRYTLADLGLKVQAEGASVADFGVAAGVHQDLGVAQVWADFQYREVVGGDTDVDAITGLGLAVEASPVDLIKVEGVFRSRSEITAGAAAAYTAVGNTVTASAADSAWAAKATVSVSDTISVYGQVASVSTVAESMAVRAGASAVFAPITVEGWFATDLAEGADDTRLFVKGSYTEGAIGAFAETKIGLGEGQGMQLKVGGSYTTESNIEYGAEYAMGDVANEDSKASKATAYAQYSF